MTTAGAPLDVLEVAPPPGTRRLPSDFPATPALRREQLRRVSARLASVVPDDRRAGWLFPLLVTLAGGVIRFWKLGRPHAVVFDETYYAKDAVSLWRFGYERDALDKVNDLLLAGQRTMFKPNAEFVVHPPLGKWLIGAGEQVFGITPFGWRFTVALLGTLTILVVARTGRRLFGSTLLGCVAGAMVAFDGLSIAISRTALLDGVITFFVAAAFGALVVDRDRHRARLARRVAAGDAGRLWGGRLGPGGGLRPWRLLGGVMLGAAAGTKWNGFFVMAAFALMCWVWDWGARKSAGQRGWFRAALVRDLVPSGLSTVGVGLVTYVVTWTGWLVTSGGWDRDWAKTHASSLPFPFPSALRALWHYHVQAYASSRSITSFHPYRSKPWSWLVLGRPVDFAYTSVPAGHGGCKVASCAAAVLAAGTPLIWWGGLFALLVALGAWALRRDWRAGAIVVGFVSGWVPWFGLGDRTIFSFYAVAYLPFVALALAYALGLLLGGRDASDRRRMWGATAAGVYVLLVIAECWWMYPILTGQIIPYSGWSHRMLLPSWI